MPTDAVVIRTGGTRAQRQLRAAQNDVKSVEYALSKARPALKHAQAQVALYEGQLKEAQSALAAAQAVADAEAAGRAPPASARRQGRARRK